MRKVGNFGLGLLLVFLLSVLTISVFAAVSPTGAFNVTPTSLIINWTNTFRQNITISTNASNAVNITLDISNTTTTISSNYSQRSLFPESSYPKYWNSSGCFNTSYLTLFPRNGTMIYTNTTTMSNGTSQNYTIVFNTQSCPPGRYYGAFNVSNSSDSTDYVTVYLTLDVDITTNNVFNTTSKSGSFLGTISQGEDYHSHFFNVTGYLNYTTGAFKLAGLGGDVDFFVREESAEIGTSINTSTSDEEVLLSGVAGNELFEIRVYGNVTSNYTGYIYFSTLNVSNATNSSTQFGTNPGSSVSLGSFNPNSTNTSILNYTIWNWGAALNATESVEVYKRNSYAAANTTASYQPIVPNFATRLVAEITWSPEAGENITDWDLHVYDPNDVLVGSSTSKYLNANATNFTRKERVVFDGPFNTTNEGFWNVSVQTASVGQLNNHTLVVDAYVDSSEWINTDFPSSFEFATVGETNSSYNFSLNLTTPNSNFIDGSYNATLTYLDGSAKSRFGVFFTATAGLLTIDEKIASSSALATINDNIGFNQTRTINISYTNSGNQQTYFVNTTSGKLELSTDSSKYVNFTLVTVPTPLAVGGNGNFNITYNVTTNITQNTAGVYTGWIFFNTTNSTITSQSYPHQTFNLTINLNLTSQLGNINITHSPTTIANVSQANTIAVNVSVALVNGTIVSQNGTMTLGNFSSVWLYEKNVTTYTSALTGLTNNSNPVCTEAAPFVCQLNATVPANLPGGYYTVNVNTSYNTGESTLSRVGTNTTTLTINNTGMELTAITSTSLGSVTEGSATYFNVSVINYGPLDATGNINMSTWAYATIAANQNGTNCGSFTSGDNYFTVAIEGDGNETCWYQWKLTMSTVSADQTTSSLSITTSDANFGTITGISVTNNNSETNTTSTTSGGGGSTTTTSADTKTLTITDYPTSLSFIMGGSNKTTAIIENSGTLAMTTKLEVELDSSISTAITPASCKIAVNDTCKFTANFSSTNTTEVGKYSGKFKAMVNSTTYDTKSFTLTVIPREEDKKKINQTYLNYTKIVEDLIKKFEALKLGPSYELTYVNTTYKLNKTTNTTYPVYTNVTINTANDLKTIEILINSSKKALNDSKTAINNGDYITANMELMKLKKYVKQIETLMEKVESDKKTYLERATLGLDPNIIYIIILAVAAIAAIVLVYYFYPRGFSRGKWRPSRPGTEAFSSFVTKLKSITKGYKQTKIYHHVPKPKSYSRTRGYSRREISYRFRKKKEIAKKIKKVARKATKKAGGHLKKLKR